MRVLVDTSVWVDYFRRGDSRLAALLESDDVLCHPFVIGELACGHLFPRQEILDRLALLPLTTQANHTEVLQFIGLHGLFEKGIGFIDVHLLASSALTKVSLWTHDKRLSRIARDLGTAFSGPAE